MVQMDGSHHDWFEGRRERAVLMVMVDDATGWTWVRFSEEETTAACYDVFEQWAKRWGLPLSLYADRDSIYQCAREPTIAEQLAGKEPQTQFGRAMEGLNVKIIPAYSPQAKGRVERHSCSSVVLGKFFEEKLVPFSWFCDRWTCLPDVQRFRSFSQFRSNRF